MNGMVHGGWGYVWGAYVVSTLVLGGYAVRAFFLHSMGERLGHYDKP